MSLAAVRRLALTPQFVRPAVAGSRGFAKVGTDQKLEADPRTTKPQQVAHETDEATKDSIRHAAEGKPGEAMKDVGNMAKAAAKRGGAASDRQPSVPLLVKALLVAGLLALAWAGVRRAQHRASGAFGSTHTGDSAPARHVTGQQQRQPDAEAHAGGATAGLFSDGAMVARAERAMRLTPSYRGLGRAETFPFFGNANRLLLASHGRLMYYRYDTDELRVLHEGQGVYYGVFPGEERGLLGEPTTLWVVSRPHNWRPESTQEWLLHLDAETGEELGRVQISSRFTHDAVRQRDRVYVANTGEGKVLELAFPSMQLLRELPLFTLKEHVNTLAPTPDGRLWAMLHNLGSSELVEVDLASGRELRRLPGVGQKAHGLVFWQANAIIALDSDGGALVKVDTGSGKVEQLWELGEANKYLKGLCVVDDIAFFGIAVAGERASRADSALSCELAAYDLRQGLLLWRRKLPTQGLLNVVAAPHLTVESTAYAVSTRPLVSYRDKPAYDQALQAVQKWMQQQEREAQGAQGAAAVAAQAAQAAAARAAEAELVAALAKQGDGVLQQQAKQEQAVLVDALAEVDQGQQAQQGKAQQAQRQERQEKVAFVEALAAMQTQEQLQQQQAGSGEAQQHAQQAQQGDAVEQLGMADGQGVVRAGGGEGQVVRALSELDPLPADDPLSQYPPVLDSVRWSSGLPRLSLSAKGSRGSGLAAGAQLRLFHYDVEPLRRQVAALSEQDWTEEVQRASNAWIGGREGNQNAFKPGARAIMLIFSDRDGRHVYRFPWHDRFKPLLEPLLLKILGAADVSNIMRLQLALMPAHGEIKRHIDAGDYAAGGHRIHAVVQSHPGVTFKVCDTARHAGAGAGQAGAPLCVPLAVEQGLVFELNNRLAHSVVNDAGRPRIHLVMDVAETPRQQRALRVGEVCTYGNNARIECAPEAADGVAAR
ncbi:green algal specific Aspartyl Asparaginyl beta-hydroxylase [Micractinium conductrix]|uniref:Green algal specific Aspartyl Asparaginyl beta-hydroxylase n=1 Tax=Micractinium conductrix TaxID=554055 RepID=A0A2P6VAU9_9CHLO|nr:green algal specific Aspartyl Asparaginyl beta-hydroxylase [Micractinium conductrix]|eukprot:PSC71222.1 green algal specific Aspartyl Asparaginyl beta-hydroxylase [Micractinium conductrix]